MFEAGTDSTPKTRSRTHLLHSIFHHFAFVSSTLHQFSIPLSCLSVRAISCNPLCYPIVGFSSTTCVHKSLLSSIIATIDCRSSTTMTIRTPVSQIKKLKKGTKSSPPLGGVPLQSLRPSIQQARDPTLELFEPSPEQHSRLPLEVAVKPKYPRHELRSESSPETNRNRHLRAVTRRPLTTFGVFSCTVLSIASLHLLYFGHLSFEGMDLTSSNVSNKKAVTSDKHNYFRSNQNLHVKGPPRVICIGNHLDNTTPSFVAEAGRNVVLYPAEFSDVTQLYDRKDDDEIADSVEMKYFPMHETNEDCVPMSPWQTYSFRK